MDVDNRLHRFAVGELDIVEETTAKERVGQFLFIVGGNDHDRSLYRANGFVRLVNVELHPIQFLQQIVGEFDIGLVDFVDQQHGQLFRCERLPQLAALDVIANVVNAFIAQLAIAQTGYRIIFVKALMRLSG